MPKTPALNTISINPSLLSFKPRQVLLANPNPKPNMNKVSVPALKPEQKALLVRSVAGYLKSNGFSKTLKKFLSEAKLEKDDFSDCSLDLEHMCCKYFEARDNGSTISSKMVQDLQKDDSSKRVEVAEPVPDVQTVSKKKKKRDDDDGLTVVVQSEESSKLTDSKEPGKEKSKEKRKSRKSSDSLSQEKEPDNKQKDNKKKKGKLNCESFVNNVEPVGTEDKQGTKAKESESSRDSLATETTMMNGNNTSLEDESVKVKGKKKKKDGSVSKTDCNKTSEEDATDKERKGSKKRKRLASEENNAEPIDEKDVEESKRRRTEGSEELKISDDQVNGNLEKTEEKSAPNKIMKKQANGSAEPKTVKAFQRVKIDEVVFTDERLKDNSYWAKDGSEIGYGAKAQEVLGQVRGRDFRHEKTKKKRGSYRGGNIDLQSHSVKFNYSDEE